MPVRTRKIREEWSSNPRLRWGAGIALAIGFFYLCLVLVDWRRELHDQYQQRTLQLYKMTALAGQEQWLLRAQAAQSVEKALQAEVPDAATIGLAQAESTHDRGNLHDLFLVEDDAVSFFQNRFQ